MGFGNLFSYSRQAETRPGVKTIRSLLSAQTRDTLFLTKVEKENYSTVIITIF